MGLSDIDEDDGPIVPPSPPPKAAAVASPFAKTEALVAAEALVQETIDLDDLFGDVHISGAPPTSQSPQLPSASAFHPLQQTRSAATQVHDVLDDLFAAPTSSSRPVPTAAAAGTGQMLFVDGTHEQDDGSNLFDFASTQRHTYNNAESFLEGFERQGKKGGGGRYDAKDSLQSLTRNKDDNKVMARLLALMNYYDVLGVAHTASEDEIRRSYKKKALELHPDRVGREQTLEEAELFKVITKANEVLMDTEKRAQYNAEIGLSSAAQGSTSDWMSHMHPK